MSISLLSTPPRSPKALSELLRECPLSARPCYGRATVALLMGDLKLAAEGPSGPHREARRIRPSGLSLEVHTYSLFVRPIPCLIDRASEA